MCIQRSGEIVSEVSNSLSSFVDDTEDSLPVRTTKPLHNDTGKRQLNEDHILTLEMLPLMVLIGPS